MDGRISEEKKLTSIAQYLLFLRHQKAYIFAGTKEFCLDKTVLEYGCGNGYGSALLAKIAKKVTAVDINQRVIDHCKQKYQTDNLSFDVITPETKTHFADQSFDLIVSFQVIEHVHNVKGYLNELKRVLKDDGVLIITTPNRGYRLYPFQKPVNPYHIREYNQNSLSKQLRAVFDQITILGISGTEEINQIERKRVNKSLLNALLRYPLKRLLATLTPRLIKKRNMAPKKEKILPTEEAERFNHYSEENYKIIAENLTTSLDFLALLRKN